ncbi:MAG: hypothetical protein IJZ13_09460 [Clostridia bacterium]|nr:hypothetical protein [Clostridia bacterium]
MTFIKMVVRGFGFLSALLGIGAFVSNLGNDLLQGIILLVIFVLISIPFFALEYALVHIEELQEDVRQLHGRLNRLSTAETPATTPKEPPLPGGRKALVNWTCQKCGAGNKAGTDRCDNCGAAY